MELLKLLDFTGLREFMEITLQCGLIGALLMFSGDMLLYYDKGDYSSKDSFNSIVAIMRGLAVKRLYLGGLLGPLSSFLYVMGFFHIVVFIKSPYELWAWAAFVISSLGIILGGAYHSHCAYLGLIPRHGEGESFEEVKSYLAFQRRFLFGLTALGNLILLVLLALGLTLLPQWLALFSPLVLLLLTPLVNRLPKGLHMVIAGGWMNLVYVIYYAILMVLLH